MLACRVSYGRVASSHGHRRTRQSLSWRRFVLVCRRRARRGSSKRWRPKLKPHFVRSPGSWLSAGVPKASSCQKPTWLPLSWSSCARRPGYCLLCWGLHLQELRLRRRWCLTGVKLVFVISAFDAVFSQMTAMLSDCCHQMGDTLQTCREIDWGREG